MFASVSFDVCDSGGSNLIVANLLERLPIPNVSSPLDATPSWNCHNPKEIEASFESIDGYLIDYAPLL